MPRQFQDQELVIASHNSGKIEEVAAFLAPFSVRVLNARDLKLPEPEETGSTYLENALIKARACALVTQKPSLGDDSGLEVAAMNNEPGLHTAPYTKQHGGRDNVFAMWAKNPEIAKNPKATFVCVLVLAWPDGHYESFEGVVEGQLTFPPRGQGGHGYDPVFVPDGHSRTIAEMTLGEKNRCSHRYIALNNFALKMLSSLPIY
jgi:XTP/dITP diphosphohydrolase